jgi:hypothetical protein
MSHNLPTVTRVAQVRDLRRTAARKKGNHTKEDTMARSLLCSAVAILALTFLSAAAASGGGPTPGTMDGGAGVLGGNVRYVTVGNGRTTTLETVRVKDGNVLGWIDLTGSWGIPAVTFDGTTGGLARNGSTLVLGQNGFGTCTRGRCTMLRTTSRFAIVTPKTLRRRETVVLSGDFAFDALSPSGRMLYLIEHRSSTNLTSYLVRGYDLAHQRLLPGAIADRTQRGWVMHGTPVSRATTANGRFVYTLYQNPGGFPFVHALDTVRSVAHCVGLPWRDDQSVIGTMKLSLRDNGRTLALAVPWSGSSPPATLPSFAIDTHTYRVSQPQPAQPSPHGGFPWWTLGLVAFPLVLVAARTWLRRRPARILAGAR